MDWKMVFITSLFLAPALSAADRTLNLPIGDPARREREVPVIVDAITDSATGELLTPPELAKRLAGVQIVLVGENHTGMDFHIVQQRVIQELLASGRNVLVGLEMYPYTEQRHLDNWSDRLLTEKGFLHTSRWYKNWGYHWNYYRDIFLFARDHGIRLFGVNTPREVISAVRKKGFTNLSPEESSHIPGKIDTADAEHFELFKSYFEDAEEGAHASLTEEQWRSMFEAQCTWDATMAHNAVRTLREHGSENTVMVVLVGSGHVAYGLGIQRQAALQFQGKFASVIPVRVLDSKDRPVDAVRASYTDFVWGLPPEPHPVYPELGISTVEEQSGSRRIIVSVEKDSPAKIAGLAKGDVLMQLDGMDLSDGAALNEAMASRRWGDSARILVRRGDENRTCEVVFRRRMKSP